MRSVNKRINKKTRMIKLFSLVLSLLWSFLSIAQPSIEPVKWSQKLSKKELNVGDEVEVIFTAPLLKAHHIYSNDFAEDCPPQKAKFIYEIKKGLNVLGQPKPIGARRYMDDIFDCEVSDFEDVAEFRQKIKVTQTDGKLGGTIEYQVCNDMGCLSFKDKFLVDIAANEVSQTSPTAIEQENTPENSIDTSEDEEPIETIEETTVEEPEVTDEDVETIEADDEDINKKSLWALFILGIIGGLIALVTPCVFPMIPMTVAFFTKQSDKAKGMKMALFYGISIVVIYIILGMLLAILFGPTFTYLLATHWLPNILFFAIFIFFALSFFGMFELTLPSSFVNKMDAQGDKGGYIGVFFIAFTLVLVSFSCTVPIVGSVSILAASGEIIKPLVAMFGFAITFALPFTLFAFFPQWLNTLPKSGGWLNSVKVVLGFLELALALKFLSQADLVYHWGLLNRDVYIALWVAIAFLMGLYLLGKIKFPHDSDLPKIPVLRFILAWLVISFGIWMIPGMWGAPLKPLSGLLPPMSTQHFFLGNAVAVTDDGVTKNEDKITYSDKLHLPHGLTGYFVYEEALAAAKKYNKPVFVDFTGHSCANCRKMEEYVWSKPEVLKRLKNDFIIASLYVDERTELPKNQQYTNENGDLIKTLGDRNGDIQLNKFKSYGQPFYYILDTEGNLLGSGGGYDPNEQKFIDFLEKGKQAFQLGSE
jgi:thiol:disulfide interchange protein DsbD